MGEPARRERGEVTDGGGRGEVPDMEQNWWRWWWWRGCRGKADVWRFMFNTTAEINRFQSKHQRPIIVLMWKSRVRWAEHQTFLDQSVSSDGYVNITSFKTIFYPAYFEIISNFESPITTGMNPRGDRGDTTPPSWEKIWPPQYITINTTISSQKKS